ncbi:MAG TPA: ParB/RepB/Spo0J family partition protein [Bacteroidetes bacterium]|nr:ParB/RepB/Spo0J family partition protein [Bacteroidota bacterium]
MAKKEDLHKGLKSLLKDIENKSSIEKKDVVKKLSNTIAFIEIDKIEYNPFQPRNEFDTTDLNELAESIKTLGLIQPVTVRNMGGERYQLISGERRLRASKIAGIKEVPAYIRLADDQAMIEMALVENIQRSDLNPIEIAFAYQRLIDECDLTHDKVAERVGKNRSTVTNYLRILKLPPTIQNGIKKDSISMGHARALAGVENPDIQLSLFNQILQQNLSVRALEQKISNLNKQPKPSEQKATDINPKLTAVENKLKTHFETKVEIKQNPKGQGQLTIKFNSDDELNYILEKMGLI